MKFRTLIFGGGAVDHAGHQCRSAIKGESQTRTARSARGQDGVGAGVAACDPLSLRPGSGGAARRGPRRRQLSRRSPPTSG